MQEKRKNGIRLCRLLSMLVGIIMIEGGLAIVGNRQKILAGTMTAGRVW